MNGAAGPSETEMLISRCIQFTLAMAYLCWCGYLAFNDSTVNANSFPFFCFLASPLLLMSYLKTTPHGDNRFMPYIVEVHESEGVLFLTDPRHGHHETRIIPMAKIQDIIVHQRFGKYSPPACIAILCLNGRVFLLPPLGSLSHGPMGLLADAIKTKRT